MSELSSIAGKKKVGLLGGTFDPVHNGHLHCATQALQDLGLDEVVLIPAANPSFKQGSELADISDRMRMCELATSDSPDFSVSDAEARRTGVTYSIDTIEQLLEGEFSDVRLYFIIGSDAFLTLPKWHRAEDLARLVDFAVLMRDDDDDADVRSVARDMHARVGMLDGERMDVSSSQIREMLESGDDVSDLLPGKVLGYIREKGLYHAR